MRAAYDLLALQEILKKFPEFKDLNKKIKLFISAQSFRIDLESAKQSLDILASVDGADGSSRMHIGRTLMLHAVMMYCRAAIEDGSGRHPMGVTSRFTPAQRNRHQDIVKLRNKTIAHYGIGEGKHGEKWGKELAVLRVVDGSMSVVGAWTRTNYLAELAVDLIDLCDTALITVEAKVHARHKDLSDALFNSADSDNRLPGLLEKHPFDPDAFYGSPESAVAFWAASSSVHEIYTPKLTSLEGSTARGPTLTTKL